MDLLTNEKHYNTLNNYYKKKYNKKIMKISLNGGFTCPNKDGKISYGGCIYCSKEGSGDFAGDKSLPLKEQFENIKSMMMKKWNDGLFIAYFQANTNTYASLDRLKELYEEAISLSDKIIMLSIATRPDCFNLELYDYLEQLNKRIPVQIELGLQTIHESTTKLINRGHDLKCFDDCVFELRKRNIEVVVHIINGLPYESKEMMIKTAMHLNTLDIQGIKIHMLHIMKNTILADMYEKEPFNLLSLDEYTDIVIEQLRHLNKNIIIHRVTGDSPKDLLIAPKWTLKKFVVMNEIDKKMRKNNIFQADKL